MQWYTANANKHEKPDWNKVSNRNLFPYSASISKWIGSEIWSFPFMCLLHLQKQPCVKDSGNSEIAFKLRACGVYSWPSGKYSEFTDLENDQWSNQPYSGSHLVVSILWSSSRMATVDANNQGCNCLHWSVEISFSKRICHEVPFSCMGKSYSCSSQQEGKSLRLQPAYVKTISHEFQVFSHFCSIKSESIPNWQ